ncbi:MAG: TIGR04086 family membrane protein [Burkholderiales bacterium]
MNVNAGTANLKTKEKKTSFSELMKNALKGTLISMIFTIAVILLFALIIKETGLKDGVIAPVNQVIKILGILAASYFAVKGMSDKQWLCGGITGLMYMLLSYLIFSLINSAFGNVALLFSDMLMGLLIGAVFAIIVASFFGGSKKAKRISRRKITVPGK